MLLLQRPTGTWEPPAGRLQPGESFEEGAVRELYEETGVLVSPQRIIATWVGEAASGRRLASVTYAGRTDRAEVRLSEEHLDHRWVTLGEWMSLPSWWSHENIKRIAGPVEAVRTVGGVREPPLPSLREETGVRARIEDAWWARVEPWRNLEDPEFYAGVGFLARHQGGEIDPEAAAHDGARWVTETGWLSLRTWYTRRESDVLWNAIREMEP